MITLLSPAKKLRSDIHHPPGQMTVPECLTDSYELIQLMKSKSVDEIAALMNLSPALATLNDARYQSMSVNDKPLSHAYPALFLFQGDVYQGLKAEDWDDRTLKFATSHLAILSGLYGLLQPMDGIWPYRLEMGTPLINARGRNLYAFWKDKIAGLINQKLAAQKNPVLLNLASSEYFKAVDQSQIKYPIVTVNFYEQKNDQLKMIGLLAKKARGTMARFIMSRGIDDLEGVISFNELGYRYQAGGSDKDTLNFVR